MKLGQYSYMNFVSQTEAAGDSSGRRERRSQQREVLAHLREPEHSGDRKCTERSAQSSWSEPSLPPGILPAGILARIQGAKSFSVGLGAEAEGASFFVLYNHLFKFGKA
jgi:hypothetical protein